MHFQYSLLISWLVSLETVGLCYWDQKCKQRFTYISWSKVHILLNCLIYKLRCNGWRNTVLILIFSFLCQFHHCLQAELKFFNRSLENVSMIRIFIVSWSYWHHKVSHGVVYSAHGQIEGKRIIILYPYQISIIHLIIVHKDCVLKEHLPLVIIMSY